MQKWMISDYRPFTVVTQTKETPEAPFESLKHPLTPCQTVICLFPKKYYTFLVYFSKYLSFRLTDDVVVQFKKIFIVAFMFKDNNEQIPGTTNKQTD